MLQEELKKKCANDQKLKWPIFFFLRFIDDGFGIMEGSKIDVEYWIKQFNGLRETIKIDKWSFGNSAEYMDIYIYTKEKSFSRPDFWIFFFSKKKSIDICIFLQKAAMFLTPSKIMC